MHIHIHSKQALLPLKRQQNKIRSFVSFVLDQEKVTCNEVGVFFISDRSMRKMHKVFFNDSSPTDCISLPIDEPQEAVGHVYLGDIFVCPETAIRYSAKKSTDPYKEITLYILHGLLHLIGYDDIDPDDRKRMRKIEKKYMNCFEKHGFILQ